MVSIEKKKEDPSFIWNVSTLKHSYILFKIQIFDAKGYEFKSWKQDNVAILDSSGPVL